MEIVKFPDQMLTSTARQVLYTNPLFDLITDGMFKAMYEHGGIGLAAPQIGLSMRFFVWDVAGSRGVAINPTLTYTGKRSSMSVEGCLSIPNKHSAMLRSESVILTAYDINWRKFQIDARGLLARVFQHEVDHLNGKLICG